MAFDTLGVNVVASGIGKVAGDISHLASSFLKYVGAVKQADAASLKAAQSQSKLADTMVNKTQKNIVSLERKYGTLISRANSLKVVLDNLNMTMRNPVSAKSNYDKAVSDVQRYEAAIKALESTMRRTKSGSVFKKDQWMVQVIAQLKVKLSEANAELAKQAKNYAAANREQDRYARALQALINVSNDAKATADDITKAYENLGEALKESGESHEAVTDAQKKLSGGMLDTENVLDGLLGMLNDSSGSFSGLTNIISTLVPSLSTVAGGFGQTSGASAALAGALGISTGALAGIVVGIGAAVLAFKAIKAAINIVVKVVQVAWQVFKKLVSVVWDVAKAIGKTLWSALTKIVSAPFRLISSLFGGVGSSMQRVLEMAIGMNLSRVWWQLGMKMRDMAKSAADAATEYQVTFNRLQTLIQNEQLGMLGKDASLDERDAAMKKSIELTKELINWTSKLAVTTIFDAEDILNVYTLAMSYGFASTQAEKLTESVLDFATGMGLGDTEMKRVIENFGQMRAQGKITGTELRDLARGSFVPVNDILEQMAKNAGLIGDYDIPNLQAITDVLKNMADNGEITNETFTTMSGILAKLGADGKITRQEFETLTQDLSQNDIMQKFGLTAEQAGKALEGIKTGKLTEELNELIKTGKITIDEFFEAFIEMVENKYPNAAKSMGLTMKAVKSNIQDYIATMIGWRLIAPVFEVVAKHVQGFIQNTLMSDKQIKLFDRMGLAFKNITELVLTYRDAMFKARDVFGKVFGTGPIAAIRRFAGSLIDMIGALGTDEKNFTEYLTSFKNALTLTFMPSESQSLVLKGITNLNKIMQDIMNGVEVDPEELKTSLDNVFGTLWKEFFGPKIKEALDYAWKTYISPTIKKVWEKMKKRFSEWKTETLIPGLKDFFGITLPGWISGISDWLIENGPGIIKSIGTFVSDILRELQKTSEFVLGPDHPLSILLELLKNIVIYGTTKITDPTSDINKENLENVVGSLERLKDALFTIVKEKLFEIPALKTFMDTLNTPGGQAVIASLTDFFNTVKDVGSINAGPITTIFEMIGNTIGGISGGGDYTIKVTKLMELIDKVRAFGAMLVSAPAVALDSFLLFIDGIVNFAASMAEVDWKGQPLVDSIAELILLFSEKEINSAAVENFVLMADKIAEFVAKIMGIDATAIRTKLRDIYNGIREFFGLKPIDFPPITGTVPVELNPDPKSTDENYVLNEDGSWTYVGPIGEGVYQGGAPTITVPLEMDPDPRSNNPHWKFDGTTWTYIGPPVSGKYPYGKTTTELPFDVQPDPRSSDPNWEFDGTTWTYIGPVSGKFPNGKADANVTVTPNTTLPDGTVVGDVSDMLDKWIDAGQAGPSMILAKTLSVDIDIVPTTDAAAEGTAIATEFTSEFSAAISTGMTAVDIPIPEITVERRRGATDGAALIVSEIAAVFSSDTTVASAGDAMMGRFMAEIAKAAVSSGMVAASIASSLAAPLNGLSGTFSSAGANAVQGLWNGMASVIDALILWWEGKVEYLNSIMPNMTQEGSPSKLYYRYGAHMMEGLRLGLESGQAGAVSQMHDAAIELRQALGAINTGTISPQQYNNVSNTTNWNVNVTTPLVASTPIQAYEILRMRAR